MHRGNHWSLYTCAEGIPPEFEASMDISGLTWSPVTQLWYAVSGTSAKSKDIDSGAVPSATLHAFNQEGQVQKSFNLPGISDPGARTSLRVRALALVDSCAANGCIADDAHCNAHFRVQACMAFHLQAKPVCAYRRPTE